MSAPEPVGVELTEATGRALYDAYGWSGCDGSRWNNLPPATQQGWDFAAARHAPSALDREAVTGVTMAHYPSAWLDEGNAPILCRCGVRFEARAYARHLADVVLALPGVTQAPTVALREAERLRTGLRCLIRDWAIGWDDAMPFDQRDGYRALGELLGEDYANDPTWLPEGHVATESASGLAEGADAASLTVGLDVEPVVENLILCGNTCGHDHNSLTGPSGCCSKHGPEPVPYLYYCDRCHKGEK